MSVCCKCVGLAEGLTCCWMGVDCGLAVLGSVDGTVVISAVLAHQLSLLM